RQEVEGEHGRQRRRGPAARPGYGGIERSAAPFHREMCHVTWLSAPRSGGHDLPPILHAAQARAAPRALMPFRPSADSKCLRTAFFGTNDPFVFIAGLAPVGANIGDSRVGPNVIQAENGTA